MSARPPLRIQDATEADVPRLLDFIRELAVFEKSEDRLIATEETLSATLFGSNRYAHALIAYDDSEPVAFAIYFFSYSSFLAKPNLYLEDILVRTAFRGLGVGEELFGFLARRATEHGCGRMEWSVLNWNEPAISFYQKLGAIPVRDWTVFQLAKEKFEELASHD